MSRNTAIDLAELDRRPVNRTLQRAERGSVAVVNPGRRLDIDIYAEGHKPRGARMLPLNLLDAPRELGRNKVLKAALGPSVEAFLKLKMDEWNDSCRFLTRWDRDHALDC